MPIYIQNNIEKIKNITFSSTNQKKVVSLYLENKIITSPKTNNMELILNIKKGLGDIAFDMPVEKIMSILGEASEVENISNAADESTTVLHYNEDGITLFFEGDNPTLQCIDISNEDCTLFGEYVFDLNEKEIVQLMVKNNFLEQDVENEDWGERRVTFPEGNIDFFLENDELLSIIIGK